MNKRKYDNATKELTQEKTKAVTYQSYQCQQDTDNKTPEFFYLPLLDSRILHCEDESFVTLVVYQCQIDTNIKSPAIFY